MISLGESWAAGAREEFGELISILVRGDEALKGEKGLGRIVVELVAKAKEKNIPFDFQEIAREIREFQEKRIQEAMGNGKNVAMGDEVEDMHTFFCFAPLIEEQLRNKMGQEFDRIKNQVSCQREDFRGRLEM